MPSCLNESIQLPAHPGELSIASLQLHSQTTLTVYVPARVWPCMQATEDCLKTPQQISVKSDNAPAGECSAVGRLVE